MRELLQDIMAPGVQDHRFWMTHPSKSCGVTFLISSAWWSESLEADVFLGESGWVRGKRLIIRRRIRVWSSVGRGLDRILRYVAMNLIQVRHLIKTPTQYKNPCSTLFFARRNSCLVIIPL